MVGYRAPRKSLKSLPLHEQPNLMASFRAFSLHLSFAVQAEFLSALVEVSSTSGILRR